MIDENQADGLRRSTWFNIAGLDYIRTAFRVARQVAPTAKLYINDYNTNVPAKRDKLFTLVQQLRAEGVPIDGVGHQMHSNVDWPTGADTVDRHDLGPQLLDEREQLVALGRRVGVVVVDIQLVDHLV